MNDIFLDREPVSSSVQKDKNEARLAEITSQVLPKVYGVPEGSEQSKKVALGFLIRERRTEIEKKRSEWDHKFEIWNRNAYEKDLEDLSQYLGDEKKDLRADFNQYHLVKLDLSMLNYFNSLSMGHQAGDEYKKGASQVFSDYNSSLNRFLIDHNIHYNAYLTGGDEFSLIMKGQKNDVEEIVNVMQSSVKNLKTPDDSLVSANADAGLASMQEAYDDFLKIEAKVKYPKGAEKGKRGRLKKYWDALADRRSDLNKYHNRVIFLVGLYKTSKEKFQHIYPFATKGALEIGLSDIAVMAESPDLQEEIDRFLSVFMLKRDSNALNRIQDPWRKLVIEHLSDATRKYLHV